MQRYEKCNLRIAENAENAISRLHFLLKMEFTDGRIFIKCNLWRGSDIDIMVMPL